MFHLKEKDASPRLAYYIDVQTETQSYSFHRDLGALPHLFTITSRVYFASDREGNDCQLCAEGFGNISSNSLK